jgi:hypothetical protein
MKPLRLLIRNTQFGSCKAGELNPETSCLALYCVTANIFLCRDYNEQTNGAAPVTHELALERGGKTTTIIELWGYRAHGVQQHVGARHEHAILFAIDAERVHFAWQTDRQDAYPIQGCLLLRDFLRHHRKCVGLLQQRGDQ